MKVSVCLITVLVTGSFNASAQKNPKYAQRLEACSVILTELLRTPDQGIPQELLDRAECVGVIPGAKKVAFVVGGTYARGAFVCRKNNGKGPWGAPAMYMLGGINFGLQIGLRSADMVLLVMNPKGMNGLVRTKSKLGADISAAIGPKGRTAEAATDISMRAEMLTYSRTHGLFAGVSLEGAMLKQDDKANRKLYGRKITAKEILLRGRVATPAAGRKLVSLLRKYSPKNISDASNSYQLFHRDRDRVALLRRRD